jgi:methyl-accepting chemotaxis protein
MKSTANVKDLFNSISSKFDEISAQIEGISELVVSIGTAVTSSMTQIAEQINNLTGSLDNILRITDIGQLKQSMHGLVETFKEELDPLKIQKLITDLTQLVQKMKQQSTEV